MLISEVTRLSETWEALNSQNGNKVFELSQYDARLERLAVERTKAHQKYYAVEREKEALLAQIAIGEKLTKAQKTNLERGEEERRHLVHTVEVLEKEVAQHRLARSQAEKAAKAASYEQRKADSHRVQAQQKLSADSKLLAERTDQVEAETHARRRAEEAVQKAEKDAEKWKKKAAAATAAANGQGRFLESNESKDTAEENVMLKRMLKCSACQQRFKTHTITRCFHLFCRECIDARLETRQRKCPSCSIGFGAQDVQQVYF